MTTEDASTWKRCNTCKKPIAFATDYFTCNVSTCNRTGTDFAFCSVSCWDAHVPVLASGVPATPAVVRRAARIMRADVLAITVDLATGGRGTATLVASDLTPAYVRFNSDYST